MKVNIIQNFKHKGQDFFIGEIRVVDASTGKYFCRAGWAEDVDGIVPTAVPSMTDIILEVEDITQLTEQPDINIGE